MQHHLCQPQEYQTMLHYVAEGNPHIHIPSSTLCWQTNSNLQFALKILLQHSSRFHMCTQPPADLSEETLQSTCNYCLQKHFDSYWLFEKRDRVVIPQWISFDQCTYTYISTQWTVYCSEWQYWERKSSNCQQPMEVGTWAALDSQTLKKLLKHWPSHIF